MPKISEYTDDTVLDDNDVLIGVDAATGTTKKFKGSVIRAGLALAADLATHIANLANPHAVSKAQVGLGSVPNTDATQRANHTGTQLASTVSDFSAAADARITAQKAQPSGLASLDSSGLLPTSQLPALAISDTFTVVSQAGMLALTAQAGDIAIRTDTGKTYILATNSPTTLGDWKEIISTGGGGGTGDMVLASAQTNTGAKTFNNNTLLDKGNRVFSVKAFGALGDDTADDTTAIQSAINAANTAGGGIVWFPAGVYKLTAALKFYTGTTPTIVAYSNITLAGAGSSSVNGTVLKQYTTAADVIAGLNDVANGAQSLNCAIQDICLLWGTATLTNSGNGLYLKQQGAGGPSYQQWNLRNVTASNFQGTGKYGFNIESMIVSTIDTCMAVACANGFFLNGAAGGAYNSVSTSVTFLNCYANMSANGVVGYNILDNTYISFVGCACDIGANSAGPAYLIDGSNCVSFQGCGSELNGVATLTNMFKVNASTQIGFYNCYAFQSKTCIDIYVTGTSTGITVVGFQDNSSVSGSTGLKVDAGSAVTEIDNGWGAVATPRNINATGFDLIVSDSAGNTTLATIGATGSIGYVTGSGGAVTQATSRTTGVTLNKISGAITTNTASLAAEAAAAMVVTNSKVAVGDVVVASIRSGSNGGNTAVIVTAVAAGSFTLSVVNNNAAAGTAETGAIIINFAVIKAVSA